MDINGIDGYAYENDVMENETLENGKKKKKNGKKGKKGKGDFDPHEVTVKF